uniref:Uncharacterized protein n=1 Tax=Triticum urartu TaxID=4572 RepID=A0A8R7QZD7_TRIUA
MSSHLSITSYNWYTQHSSMLNATNSVTMLLNKVLIFRSTHEHPVCVISSRG